MFARMSKQEDKVITNKSRNQPVEIAEKGQVMKERSSKGGGNAMTIDDESS